MAADLVSVIMPVFNSELYVSEAIRSVLGQSHENLELLVIDDASTDYSLKLIHSFQDERLRYIELAENVGAGEARNQGIRLAKGRYIAFIDSDDVWIRDKLTKQIRFMKEEKASLSYTDYFLMNGESRFTHLVRCPEQVDLRMMKKNNYIGCLTAIYDAQILGKMCMPERRKRQDWALWLDILGKTDRALGLGIPLAAYRKTRHSLSRNKFKLVGENYRFYREVLGYNAFVSMICLMRFLWSHFRYKIAAVKSID